MAPTGFEEVDDEAALVVGGGVFVAEVDVELVVVVVVVVDDGARDVVTFPRSELTVLTRWA
jgi:hypothetical protein